MTKVFCISYSVDVSFNKEKDIIYMDIYIEQENGESLVERNVIPYIAGTNDVDLLMEKWLGTRGDRKSINKAIIDGFKKELKELLKQK